jgi:Holliday junction resolvase-like predicted endonuclease
VAYPNQRRVKWWERPRNFDRSLLPKELVEWVARPGTIAIRDYDLRKLRDALAEIPSEEQVSKAMEVKDEDEIKDYMEAHLQELEECLSIIQREYQTSTGPMDFLARDKSGTDVVIEVKMRADDTTVTQTRRYMRSYRKDKRIAKIRGIIVAQEFTQRCLDDAEELKDVGFDLTLLKCRKAFNFEPVAK